MNFALESRAKVMKTDVIAGGESKFAKASFETSGNETNREFWSKVLRKNHGKSDYDEMVRRCRTKTQDNGGDFGRKTIKNMIDHGYRGLQGEHKVLKIAFALRRQTDMKSLTTIHKLLFRDPNCDSDDSETEIPENLDTDEMISRFGEITLAVIEKLDKILIRVAFFRRLECALFFLRRTDIVWPIIEPPLGTPASEYGIIACAVGNSAGSSVRQIKARCLEFLGRIRVH